MAAILGILKISEIIDKLVELDRSKKALDDSIKMYQAELQKRGLRVIEDKNIKQKVFYGSDSNRAEVTYTQSIEVINYAALRQAVGELFDEYIQRNCEFKYKFDTKFGEVIKAIFTEDYTDEMVVADVLNTMDITKQESDLLKKKLKGDYKKDREVIISTLGLDSEKDLDVELDYIHKAIMWERIRMYFPNNTKQTIEDIKHSLIVTQTPKLAVKYNEE